ncbi:hypothetical protein HHK36_000508 [Tetracentron sinense]|uniref:Neprosin PEP catalytic domain-containing protein n=1 Tax=Tetracentron sinense TaxID=13715 RepID=A0A834ZVZ5_TETSI|nr:hypothetical protein HHK36_000508 [Tetracentron sinense]
MAFEMVPGGGIMGLNALIAILIVLCLSLTSSNIYGVEGLRSIPRQEDINKPPIKIIQMKPSSLLRGVSDEAPSIAEDSNIEFPSEDCPLGTVPIRRTRREDLVHSKSQSEPYLGDIHQLTLQYPGKHFATLDTVLDKPYYGAKALINLQNPSVEMDKYSTAQIWIENGILTEINSIQVGWAVTLILFEVHPRLYGDNGTHLTAYWTADSYNKTGCFNTLCPGFVQTHSKIALGAVYEKTSTYEGDQRRTNIKIAQDLTTGSWWLTLEDSMEIGYWPKEIFTHLNKGANYVRYGGMVYSTSGIIPPMGSSRWPDNFLRRSCYFSNIKIVNEENMLVDIDKSNMKKYTDNQHCYDLIYWGYEGKFLEQTFTFGGPSWTVGQCGIN